MPDGWRYRERDEAGLYPRLSLSETLLFRIAGGIQRCRPRVSAMLLAQSCSRDQAPGVSPSRTLT